LPDVDGDADIAAADLASRKSQFGAAAPAVGALTAVPEPDAAALLVIA
jgi:hypothetical protein